MRGEFTQWYPPHPAYVGNDLLHQEREQPFMFYHRPVEILTPGKEDLLFVYEFQPTACSAIIGRWGFDERPGRDHHVYQVLTGVREREPSAGSVSIPGGKRRLCTQGEMNKVLDGLHFSSLVREAMDWRLVRTDSGYTWPEAWANVVHREVVEETGLYVGLYRWIFQSTLYGIKYPSLKEGESGHRVLIFHIELPWENDMDNFGDANGELSELKWRSRREIEQLMLENNSVTLAVALTQVFWKTEIKYGKGYGPIWRDYGYSI
jgi:8-oxo-dGTP pyrophosphatase MutT (NUDIX family)